MDILKDAEFTKELNVKHKSFKKGPVCVHTYITIISKIRLNTIKFDTTVLAYLHTHKAFIYSDRFLRNDVSSPGLLIELHPDLVRYDDLEENTHAPKHNANDATPVPDFSIKQAEIKCGGDKPTALKIHCTEKDCLYLKSMMSYMWEALETLRG
eukprot:8713519-Ditylum_brightwellii.AAC.1